ncbi:MAG: hypothetical protein ACP5GJ_03980 [Nanopusillaceae archaeon]
MKRYRIIITEDTKKLLDILISEEKFRSYNVGIKFLLRKYLGERYYELLDKIREDF